MSSHHTTTHWYQSAAIGAALVLALFATPAWAQTTNTSVGTNSTNASESAGTSDTNASGSAGTATESASGQLLHDGVFGCGAGRYAMKTGTLAAIGGVYVPTNDAAVTLNSGYLTYKECTLDGMVSALGEAALGELIKQMLNFANAGFDGRPLYVGEGDIGERLQDAADVAMNNFLSTFGQAINQEFRRDVTYTLADNYLKERNSPQSAYHCPKTIKSAKTMAEFFRAAGNPACDPFRATLMASQDARDARDAAQAQKLYFWQINNGFESSNAQEQIPVGGSGSLITTTTVTPGYLISEALGQALTSGFRKLENANEIGQIVNQLFSGLTQQVLTSGGGLAGLSKGQNGQPSYLERLTTASSDRIRQATINTALEILSSSYNTETNYKNLRSTAKTALENAQTRLRAAENTCWGLIEKAVTTLAQQGNCSTDAGGNQVCTGGGVSFTVATSTTHSDAVIDSQITALLHTITSQIEDATLALKNIANLIADVTNNNSATAQKIALQKLDQLVANDLLHDAYDVKQAQEDATNVQSNTNTLVDTTLKEWGTGSGWCDVENPEVVQQWLDAWKN